MLFVSAAHSVLRLVISLLLLKNVWARQIERRSLFFGRPSSSSPVSWNSYTPGIRYAFNPSQSLPPHSLTLPQAASLAPQPPSSVFSHQMYHDYDLQPYHHHSQQQSSQHLGSGSLIPIAYGAGGSTGYSYPTPAHNNQLSIGQGIVEDDVVEPYYYHGDRILKQYLVSEKSKHDLLIDSHLGNPFQPPPVLRYEARQLPFGGIVDVPVFATNDLEDKLHPFKPSTLRKNHGPIALGSGSLGLISLANGNVYLGSGSLGYVSEKQHVDTLVKPTQKPFLIAGPTQFGTN